MPLAESVETFFEREVKPHVPDACIDTSKRDARDSQVGLVGYEINFNRSFYRYTPPRALEEIEVDIRAIEHDIVRMLSEGDRRRHRASLMCKSVGSCAQVPTVRHTPWFSKCRGLCITPDVLYVRTRFGDLVPAKKPGGH